MTVKDHGYDFAMAWHIISEKVSRQQIENLEVLSEDDFVSALSLLLADAGIEDPDALLVRAGLIEQEAA